LHRKSAVRWRFQATPWRRRARGHTGMDRGDDLSVQPAGRYQDGNRPQQYSRRAKVH